MDVKKSLLVVDAKCTSELALTQQIVERDSRPNRDARSELLPPVASVVKRSDELLRRISKSHYDTCNQTYVA